MERVRFRAVQLWKSRDALTPAGGPFRRYAPEGTFKTGNQGCFAQEAGLVIPRPNSLSGLIVVEGRVF